MEKTVETLVQELIEAAKFHDWFYEYSDDYSHWTRGSRQRENMNRAFCALDDVDSKLSVETWNKLAPINFRFSNRDSA